MGQRFFTLKKMTRSATGPYLYETIRHLLAHKRMPQLAQPKTFNDKVGKRKLFERAEDYPTLADKVRVRGVVAQRLGNTVLSDLYFAGDNLMNLNVDALPQAFVIKATHGSGPEFISFVHDRQSVPVGGVASRAQALLEQDYGNITNEWWYTEIKPQVMVEELLRDETFGIPIDYKFFVFHGRVAYIQVDYARFERHTRTFYDRDWQPQEFVLKYPQGPVTGRPKLLSEMIEMAECLAAGFDFIRVDLYCVNDSRIVFGELTLAPEAGWGRFQPARWDQLLGQLW